MLEVVYGSDKFSARVATTQSFDAGDVIYRFNDCDTTEANSYQTIQVDSNTHIHSLGSLDYLNHSCRPNVVVDTTQMACYASFDLPVGSELTYFYPSTEWDMTRPFVCSCPAPECIRIVAGAKFLSLDILGRYFINAHIRDLAMAHMQTVSRKPTPS